MEMVGRAVLSLSVHLTVRSIKLVKMFILYLLTLKCQVNRIIHKLFLLTVTEKLKKTN